MNKKLEKLNYKLHESIFIGFFIRLAEYLYNLIGRSLIAKLMTGYDNYEMYASSSLTSKIFGRFKISENKKLKWKMACSKAIDESFFAYLMRSLINTLLGLKIRLYGVGFFTFGVFTIIVDLIKESLVEPSEKSYIDIMIGFGIMVLSIPMIIHKSSTGKLIADGIITGFITRNIIGMSREEMLGEKRTEKTAVPIIVGALLGLCTIVLSPIYIFAAMAGAIFLILAFSRPEFGVIFLGLVLPFIPTMVMCAYVILLFGAYLLKLIRGKRTLKFDALDISVLVFLAFMSLGGIISVDRASSVKSAAVFVCLGMSYFLVVNLIKNTLLVKRMIGCMLFSTAVCSAYGIFQNFFTVNSTWHDSSMFSDISTRVVSTFENPNVFGEFLIMMLPFVLAFFLTKDFKNSRFTVFITLVASLAALVFTWSRGAWIGFIVSMFVFFLVYSKSTMIFYCFGLIAIPFLPLLLPDSIINRFVSIGDMRDSSTSYRVYIWEAAVKMIEDFFASGIGIGEGAFSKVYPDYTLAGIEMAPHSHNLFLQILIELGVFGFLAFAVMIIILMQKVFTYIAKGKNRTMMLIAAAGMCAVIAMLVQGITDYVWYNYRVYGLFFIVIGICSASINSAKSEEQTEVCQG